MIRRSFLYFILVMAIISVPVFQAAHELTHVNDTDIINLAHADNNHDQEDTDLDQLCLDCIALAAFSIIFAIFAYFFINLIRQGVLHKLKPRLINSPFFLIYPKRAPPLV